MVWSNPSGDLKAGTVPAGLSPGTSTTLSPKKQVLRIYARSCNLNDFKLYEQWGAYSEQRCTLGARGCILRAERCILDTGILAIEGALRSGHAGSSLPCSRLSYIIEHQDDDNDDDNDDGAGLAMSIMMTLGMTIIMTLKMLIMMTPAMSIIMTLGMLIMMMLAMLIMMTLALSIMITIAMSIMMSSLSLKLSSSNMIPAHCWSAL